MQSNLNTSSNGNFLEHKERTQDGDKNLDNTKLIEAHRTKLLSALTTTLPGIPIEEIFEQTIEVTEFDPEDQERSYEDFKHSLVFRAMDMVDLVSEIPEYQAQLEEPEMFFSYSDFQYPLCTYLHTDSEFQKTVFSIVCPAILETAEDLRESVDIYQAQFLSDSFEYVERICDEFALDKPKTLQNLLEERLGTQANEVVLQMKTKESTLKHQKENVQVMKRR